MDLENTYRMPQGISIARNEEVSALLRGRRVNRLIGQELNLPQQETLLVVELVVLRAILEESRQEFQQALAVVDEKTLHLHRLVRVRNEYLDMSGQSAIITTPRAIP